MKRAYPARQFGATQRGLILLDGLIAILIFSIGVLGMVALQATAVKFTTDAKYRTDAAMFADQIIAQMWGAAKSPTALPAYATGGTAYTAWVNNVINDLPGASTANTTVTFNGTLVTVAVSWQLQSEKTASMASPPLHTYTAVSQIVP